MTWRLPGIVFSSVIRDEQRSTLKLFASLVKHNGLLVFTSGVEAREVWGENGGYDLYQILQTNNFQVLCHNIRDQNCGNATVWLAQRYSK
ncbi:hypothetical protein [Legionella tunisiensis]|uniref:hypothetical protein n=1 Tax=Legionella tunisiensis TaxID=1034944 RepID=UPI0006882C73|nr:hypothetical protein [Legionella tunisiensis]